MSRTLSTIALASTLSLFGIPACGSSEEPIPSQTEAPTSQAPAAVSASQAVALLSHLSATATAGECDNSGGPWVTLEGALSLGGMDTRFIFRNNTQGTHEAVVETSTEVQILAAGESITIPKQPSRGGVGGNPLIWLQLVDGSGNALTSEIFLGRCNQGLSAAEADFIEGALASLNVQGDDCTNHPGPYITMDGSLTLGGVKARLIFRNADNRVGGPHVKVVTTTTDVELITEGGGFTIPKQPVNGGAGGNPRVYLQFLGSGGDALSDEIYLGRCNKI
jgi:hypothetical protein